VSVTSNAWRPLEPGENEGLAELYVAAAGPWDLSVSMDRTGGVMWSVAGPDGGAAGQATSVRNGMQCAVSDARRRLSRVQAMLDDLWPGAG
jgi:hypothetical protein